jgi:hypothetical protein
MPIDQPLLARGGRAAPGAWPRPDHAALQQTLERFDIRVSSRFVIEWLDEGVA